jgi:hypothetical protein
MRFYHRDSETGYYDDEVSFFAHDWATERAEAQREARFEAEADEMLGTLWLGEDELLSEQTTARPKDRFCVQDRESEEDAIDPETGCTAREMGERRIA